MRCLFGRSHAEQTDQRARGATMGGDHGVSCDRRVPSANPHRELLVALAPGWQEMPLVALALGDDILVKLKHVEIGEALPLAEGNFAQPVVDFVASRRK